MQQKFILFRTQILRGPPQRVMRRKYFKRKTLILLLVREGGQEGACLHVFLRQVDELMALFS